jgi:hypothetical protein
MPYVTPSQPGVVVAGNPIIEELRWKTVDATHSIPGRFVVKDTTDSEIKLQSSGGAGTIGIVLIDPTKVIATGATAGDWARVAHGPGVVVSAYYDKGSGNSCTKGDALYCGDNGKVYKGSTDATKIVATAEESKAADGVMNVRLAI